jgi:hypothetical protein
MRSPILLSLFILLAGVTPASAAEYDRPPGSVFAAFNLGVGWAKASVDEDRGNVAETDAQVGPMWGFRVGTALTEILALSVDYIGYASVTDQPAEFERIESEFWVIGPSLSWYPFEGGFFLKGLAGWGGVDFRIDVDADTRVRANEKGLGLLAGIGYEIPVNTLLSLGAEVDYLWMNVKEVEVADGTGGTTPADFGFYSLGFNAFVILNY